MNIPSYNARNDPVTAKMKKENVAALILGGVVSFLAGFWIAPVFSGGGLSHTLEFIRENDMLWCLVHPSLWEWSVSGLKAAVLCLAIYLSVRMNRCKKILLRSKYCSRQHNGVV